MIVAGYSKIDDLGTGDCHGKTSIRVPMFTTASTHKLTDDAPCRKGRIAEMHCLPFLSFFPCNNLLKAGVRMART
jgi:hypothetical protein